MDIRSLQCFLAVAERLHFRQAAEELNLSQSALSLRIQALEDEIGTPLFQRNRRHVGLTTAGNVFLEPARAAVANALRGKAEARRAARGETGSLRLGFTVIVFYGVLPEAVRDFRVRYPEVNLELREINSPAQEVALAAGEIDLGILHPPLTTPDLTLRSLPAEELVLALPSGHRLTQQSSVDLSALQSEPLLMAPRGVGPHLYDQIIAMFQTLNISPTVVQEVTPMTSLLGLVATGVGMGFVTQGMAQLKRPGVSYINLKQETPSLPVAAAWKGQTPSPTAERFLNVVLDKMALGATTSA